MVKKGTPVTLVTSIPEAKRIASLATSVEEITPRPKRQSTVDKGKEMVGFQLIGQECIDLL